MRKIPLGPTLVGIGFMTLSMMAFSVMTTIIRWVSYELPTPEIVFLRNLFSLVMLLPWILYHGPGVTATKRPFDHFWRAVLGILGMQGWFYGISQMPITEVTALSFTAPIFSAIFAIVFLKEQAGIHRWSAIVIGFIGAMVILQPNEGVFHPAASIVLMATSMWAIAGVLVKSLSRTEPPMRIVFYMSMFMTVLAAPPALYVWQTPTPLVLVGCVGVAIASTAAHFCLVRAYAVADIVVLMPFDFTRLLFVGILSYIFFEEVANLWDVVGGCVIVASAAYIAYRESRRKLPATGELSGEC